MKLFRVLTAAVLLAASSAATAAVDDIGFMPMPNSVTALSATPVKISGVSAVDTSLPDSSAVMRELNDVLHRRLGTEVPAADGIVLTIAADASMQGAEHYRLTVSADGIDLRGASDEALFRGLQTLDQVLASAVSMDGALWADALEVDDAPRYARRALMLDPARHFLPADDVKRFIDVMARYKYNVLQLHLTDDEGWRMEVKSHPELTASGDYYTQDELRDLVDYAAGKFIEIVPELDVPGHTTAVLTSHPELGCVIADSAALKKAGGNGRMLCASRDGVYTLYDDIIAEVADVFPSPFIHLGGDEAAVERNWALCPHCRELMEREGYSKPSDIMIYFFDRILASVRRNDRKPILWCELDNIYPPANDYLFPYPDDVTLVTWRNGLTPKCQELTAARGHDLIMAPGEQAYLDYPQYKNDFPEFNNWGMPITTLEKSYTLDPGDAPNITGVMGTLWGEAIPDVNRALYMAFPRALALAEAGWTQMSSRGWDSFRSRLVPVLSDMMRSGVSFRVPFEIYR